MKRFVIVMLLGSCSASNKTATSASIRPQTLPTDDPRAMIEKLDREIAAERTNMGLPEAATPMAACADCPIEPFAVTPNSAEPACHHANTDTCTQSCTLSDSICTNADKICNLAKQLHGDKWAADKCSKGKTTCDSAHASCCSCQ